VKTPIRRAAGAAVYEATTGCPAGRAATGTPVALITSGSKA